MGRKQGLLKDLFEVTATLPWWVGVVLAIVSYLVLHSYSTAEITVSGSMKDMPSIVGGQVIRALATIFQYVLPFVFLIASATSAFHAPIEKLASAGMCRPTDRISRLTKNKSRR